MGLVEAMVDLEETTWLLPCQDSRDRALGVTDALLSHPGPPCHPRAVQWTGGSHTALCPVGLCCSIVLPVLHLTCDTVMACYKVSSCCSQQAVVMASGCVKSVTLQLSIWECSMHLDVLYLKPQPVKAVLNVMLLVSQLSVCKCLLA